MASGASADDRAGETVFVTGDVAASMHRRDTRPARPDDEATRTQLAALTDAVETTQRRIERLETAVRSLSRQSETALGSPCSRCDRSLLLVTGDAMECPACGYERPL